MTGDLLQASCLMFNHWESQIAGQALSLLNSVDKLTHLIVCLGRNTLIDNSNL